MTSKAIFCRLRHWRLITFFLIAAIVLQFCLSRRTKTVVYPYDGELVATKEAWDASTTIHDVYITVSSYLYVESVPDFRSALTWIRIESPPLLWCICSHWSFQLLLPAYKDDPVFKKVWFQFLICTWHSSFTLLKTDHCTVFVPM